MAPASKLRASLVPLLLLVAGGTSRCELSTESGTGELHIVGTVKFFEVGGGCWQVIATDGGRYELRVGQAPEAVLRDGARVALIVRVREESETTCQVGTPVDVREVVEVNAGR